jgi:hypothetical protein
MKTIKVSTIQQIEKLVDEIQTNLAPTGRTQFIENYRGQSNNSYKLVNGIGRANLPYSTLRRREKRLFNHYVRKVKKKKINYIQNPYNKNKYKNIVEWFYQYQAQHIGIKTRLMDWTMRWEVALLFAVYEEKYFGIDGQFWVFICPREFVINSGNLEELYNFNPLKIRGNYMINSPFYQDPEGREIIPERRRMRQHGRFFTQSFKNSLIPLEEQKEINPYLTKVIIDGNSKEQMKKDLGRITADWLYYRHDETIDEEINKMNKILW